MTPALPFVSGAEVVKALLKGGFERIGQRGSHVKLPDRRIESVVENQAGQGPETS